MFTNSEEIAVPDVADNFLSGPSWYSAGLLCHPSNQLPISCLITDLTDFFTNTIKISSTVFALLVSWVYTESNCALASRPACFPPLEAQTAEQSSLQQRHRAALPWPHRLPGGLCWAMPRQPWAVLPLGKSFPEPSCSATAAKGESSSSSLQGQLLPNECQPHILRRHSMYLPELRSPLHRSNIPALGHEIFSSVTSIPFSRGVLLT